MKVSKQHRVAQCFNYQKYNSPTKTATDYKETNKQGTTRDRSGVQRKEMQITAKGMVGV